ncbi:MAG TPA: class I SAM-dependent methyltransferase [Candidatus Ozemobacteraceae bacterium]|nr:class I SAM-dependent methyltransferase [Candidatus Ozemobacteraceae bacterium]
MDNKADENKLFWNELCGTSAFRALGLSEVNRESLRTFDNWYFEYYSYLPSYLNLHELSAKRVLEIGLGFGTVGEALFSSSMKYVGVDYAENPVRLMRQRIRWREKQDSACVIQSDARCLPFEDESFDYVVSLGCLHHTGDTEKSIREVHRVLKKPGKAIIMLYREGGIKTKLVIPLKYVVRKLCGMKMNYQSYKNACFDSNLDESAAPIIDLLSKRRVKECFARFSHARVAIENLEITSGRIQQILRTTFNSSLGRMFGQDYYITAEK